MERSKKRLVGLGSGRVDDESLELRLLRGRQLREHALHLLTTYEDSSTDGNIHNKKKV